MATHWGRALKEPSVHVGSDPTLLCVIGHVRVVIDPLSVMVCGKVPTPPMGGGGKHPTVMVIFRLVTPMKLPDVPIKNNFRL